MAFGYKLWNFILIAVLIVLVAWYFYPPEPTKQTASFDTTTSVEVLNTQLKELQAELHAAEKEKEKPSLEDIGVWTGIATLVVTVIIAAAGIFLGHTYIQNIAEEVAKRSNLLISGRTYGAMAMLACHIQWNKAHGYSRNTTVDLHDWIIKRGRLALDAFLELKREKLETADGKIWRLACMNNLLFAYALADDQRYGRDAAYLLADWRIAFHLESREVNYRLTEIRVEVTYPEHVFKLNNNLAYRNQLAVLRTEINTLADLPDADQGEITSLLHKLEATFRRFPIA